MLDVLRIKAGVDVASCCDDGDSTGAEDGAAGAKAGCAGGVPTAAIHVNLSVIVTISKRRDRPAEGRAYRLPCGRDGAVLGVACVCAAGVTVE